MRVIIAGTRTCDKESIVEAAIRNSGVRNEITVVVTGGCRGVDTIAEEWARRNNIPCKVIYPNWELYGVSAGPKRNKQMVKEADALIAVWDGKSKGTQNIIEIARRFLLKVYVYRFDEYEAQQLIT